MSLLPPLLSFFRVFEDEDLEDEAACAAAFFHGCGGGEATPSGAVHFPGERFGWGAARQLAPPHFSVSVRASAAGVARQRVPPVRQLAPPPAVALRGMRFGIGDDGWPWRCIQCLEWNDETNWRGLGP